MTKDTSLPYIPIFMYHFVNDNETTSKLSISPKSFERHLRLCQLFGARTATITSLLSNDPIPKNTIAITFDDGCSSCFETAFPIMQRFTMVGTFFVSTRHLDTAGYLRKDDMHLFVKAGHEIGSHTCSHLWLPSLSRKDLEYEIVGSKQKLEDILGIEITSFAYPMGGLTQEIVDIVRHAGYRCACATNPPPGFAWNDRFTLRRIKMSRSANNPCTFWYKMSGLEAFIQRKRKKFSPA